MPSERVLICGAGVAGSILAFWLAKHDFEVVVVERSKAEQKTGQGLEIEEPALKVVKLMSILDVLNERKLVRWDSTLLTSNLVHPAFSRSVALVLQVPSNSCG